MGVIGVLINFCRYFRDFWCSDRVKFSFFTKRAAVPSPPKTPFTPILPYYIATMPKQKRTVSKKGAKKVQKARKSLKSLPKYQTLTYQEKEARIAEALKAYHDPDDEDITTLPAAARAFGVPRSTLWNRDHGTKSLSENGGHNTRLNEAQEALLIWYSDVAIERGFPLNYDMIITAATSILKATGKDISGDKERLGPNWAYRWVAKQSELGRYHSVTTKPMDYRRKDALTPELIKDYFSKLEAVISKYEIQVSDIYNVDETGFRVGCIHSTTVITHKNIRHVSSP